MVDEREIVLAAVIAERVACRQPPEDGEDVGADLRECYNAALMNGIHSHGRWWHAFQYYADEHIGGMHPQTFADAVMSRVRGHRVS